MVGLNHEMGRELLWRGYPDRPARHGDGAVLGTCHGRPTSQHTAVQTFPDRQDPSWRQSHGASAATGPKRTAARPGAAAARRPDPALPATRASSWPRRNGPRGGAGQVLHHPDGRPIRRPLPLAPATTAAPLFAGRLEPDVLFLGFAVRRPRRRAVPKTPPATRAGSSCSPSSRPNRGSSLARPPERRTRPANGRLNWRDLARRPMSAPTPQVTSTWPLTTTAQSSSTSSRPAPRTAWDGRSDTLAAILLHRPFRLFVHASDLLPTGGGAVTTGELRAPAVASTVRSREGRSERWPRSEPARPRDRRDAARARGDSATLTVLAAGSTA